MKYLAFDTEAGGVTEDSSLLEAYFDVLDEHFNVVASCWLKTKPDSGVYQLTAGGMDVNKIDIIQHDKVALTYSKAADALRLFLYTQSNGGKEKLVPLGHGVAGDIDLIVRTLFKGNRDKWTQYASVNRLDTGVIAQYLKVKQVLPSDLGLGLEDLCEYFKIGIKGWAHTAPGDTRMTVEVFKRL